MIIIQFQMLINHLFQNCEPNNDLNYVGPGVYSADLQGFKKIYKDLHGIYGSFVLSATHFPYLYI